jgi:hypothetical protein
MLSVIAVLGYSSFLVLTAALVWAAEELIRANESRREWRPGTNPHAWRF